MSVQSTARYAGPFAGNTVTTVFAFAFKVFATTDAVVLQTVTATGAVSNPSNGTDYTVALNADQTANPGGTITFAVAPPATVSFYITSGIPKAQASSFPNPGPWNPTTAENAWDKSMAVIQEIDQAALKFAPGDVASPHVLPSPAARKNLVLGFDATGALTVYNTALSAVTDAANVNFLPSGAGAISLPVQAKLRQYPRSNTEFASFQALIDSFGNTAANSAGEARLPLGTYNQGSTVTFNGQNGFSIEGAGKYLTNIQAIAGAAGLPLLFFDRGAYCSIRRMSINGLLSGAQIGSAIEAKMTANAGPTPQGMIYEDLYIDGQQTAGFSTGIRFTAAAGQDNNNERAFIKNCDFARCATGISFEHYNSLVHQIFGGVIGSCGVGISTANISSGGNGGSYTANGVTMIANTGADFDVGDLSTHSIDIVNCKSEASTGLWIRCLQTGAIAHGAITGTFQAGETVTQAVSGATGKFVKEVAGTMTLYNVVGTFNAVNILTGGTSGATAAATGILTVARQDINVINSTCRAVLNNACVDYRGAGKVVIQGCQIQQTGATRKLSFTHPSSTVLLIGNFMDIDSIESAGTVIMMGNKYAGAAPTLAVLGGTGKFINLDDTGQPQDAVMSMAPLTSGTITINAAVKTLSYVKVGRQVTFAGLLNVSSVAAPVGRLRISGLPFAAAGGNKFEAPVLITTNTLTANIALIGTVSNGQSFIDVFRQATPNVDDAAAVVQAGSNFWISGTYFTT